MSDSLIQKAWNEPDDTLIPIIDAFLKDGGDANHRDIFGRSLLENTFKQRKMSSFKFLIDNGVDVFSLGWPNGYMSIALGESEGTYKPSFTEAKQRNTEGLTPFLFAVSIGNQDIAEAWLPFTKIENRKGGSSKHGALYYAVEYQHVGMIDWLLSQGFNVNEASLFGETALHAASERRAPHIVEKLINAGADVNAKHNLTLEQQHKATLRRKETPAGTYDLYEELLGDHITFNTPMCLACDGDTAMLLYQAGAPFSELTDREVRAEAIGAPKIAKQKVTQPHFETYKHRVFGQSNPEVTNHAFWIEQIRTHDDGYNGFKRFCQNERDYSDPAIWSFDRFGQSFTELSDGRWLVIGGEHEDYYDPDFCIYNDVVVLGTNGEVTIHSYPAEIFQPTDFHSTTLFDNTALIIGNMGYRDNRDEGQTPVYQLDLETFSIAELQTYGNNPGWICGHEAKLIDDSILISGGEIWKGLELVPNDAIWELSLSDRVWKRKTIQ